MVAGSEQKLLVELLLKARGNEQAKQYDDAENADDDTAKGHAVPEHDADANEQERAIKNQGDRCTGNKFANGFHAMQTGGNDTRGTMLKVPQGKFKEVVEDIGGEDGIDPIAGMQNQVLPHPTENGAEDHKDAHGNGDDNQRAGGAVDDDFINDGLGKERGAEREQLQNERGEQDIAPDFFMFEQFGNEPAKTKLTGGIRAIGVFEGTGLGFGRENLSSIVHAKFAQAGFYRSLRTGSERGNFFGSAGDDDGDIKGVRGNIRNWCLAR